jgi:hypothetical protein
MLTAIPALSTSALVSMLSPLRPFALIHQISDCTDLALVVVTN